jgi:hypothetical protein
VLRLPRRRRRRRRDADEADKESLMRHVNVVLLLTLAAACGNGGGAGSLLTYPGIEGHSPYFQLAGTAHQPGATGPVQCQSCHTGDSFRQFTCTGCHTNANPTGTDVMARTTALHTDTSGNPFVLNGVTYAYDSPTCLLCHPRGSIPHLSFPIGTGTAHDLACAQCHTDLNAKTDLTKLACIACHATSPGGLKSPAAAHQQLRSPEYTATVTNQDCIRCHADAQVDRIASHGRQRAPVGLGDSGCRNAGCTAGASDGNHGNFCFACHSSRPPLYGGSQAGARGAWAQDWSAAGLVDNAAANPSTTSCNSCH